MIAINRNLPGQEMKQYLWDIVHAEDVTRKIISNTVMGNNNGGEKMICPDCKSEIADDSKICSNCGFETQEDFEYCPKCGRKF